MAGSVDLQIETDKGPIDYDAWTTGTDAGHIHCMTFDLLASCGVAVKSGRPEGTRDYGQGVRITKRLDSTSPVLLDLFNKRTGITAKFTFHTPDTSTSESSLQVALVVTIGVDKRAWVRSYRLVAPNTDVAAADGPKEPYEEITFSFSNIEFQRTGLNNADDHCNLIAKDDLTQMTA